MVTKNHGKRSAHFHIFVMFCFMATEDAADQTPYAVSEFLSDDTPSLKGVDSLKCYDEV